MQAAGQRAAAASAASRPGEAFRRYFAAGSAYGRLHVARWRSPARGAEGGARPAASEVARSARVNDAASSPATGIITYTLLPMMIGPDALGGGRPSAPSEADGAGGGVGRRHRA